MKRRVEQTIAVIRDAIALSNVRERIVPVKNSPGDFDPLPDLVGDSAFVLLGEATHGTHEFYRARAEITKRLIAERGFNAHAAPVALRDKSKGGRLGA